MLVAERSISAATAARRAAARRMNAPPACAKLSAATPSPWGRMLSTEGTPGTVAGAQAAGACGSAKCRVYAHGMFIIVG